MNLRRILVPIDFSDGSLHAMRYAAELGQKVGAEVEVMHVWNAPAYMGTEGMIVHLPGNTTGSLRDYVHDQAKKELEATVDAAREKFPTLKATLAEGDPREVIRETSAAFDLLVIGTHGRTGLTRLVLGSVAEDAVRHAACPVLTVRTPHAPKA